ncbi:MAG TPA: hypothetical protein VKZ50_08840, partial [bacterium]|nr:hypothetical protein [bacterium]
MRHVGFEARRLARHPGSLMGSVWHVLRCRQSWRALVTAVVMAVGVLGGITGAPPGLAERGHGAIVDAEAAAVSLSRAEVLGVWHWWCCGGRHGSLTLTVTPGGDVTGYMDQLGLAGTTRIQGVRVHENTLVLSRAVGADCVQ